METCVAVLVLLSAVQGVILLAAPKVGPKGTSVSNTTFRKLQCRFFLVYFPATLADWLQGPYVYRLYSSYGYRERDIAHLYVAGFVSSMTLGSVVAPLADILGRKRLCVAYGVVTSASCLVKLSADYRALLLGRVLAGVGTSILLSAFEAWYVWQHVERCRLPPAWMGATLARASFYNGLLAVAAGIVADAAVEWARLGPAAPFVLALPCLAASSVGAATLWSETDAARRHDPTSPQCGVTLLLLGAIQSLFESAMYIFVFLWTPVLEPMSPPHGVVFSSFMVCVMMGSSLYSLLVHLRWQPQCVLTSAVALAALSLCTCAVAVDPRAYFAAFLAFEVAVGLFFPAVAYLRSRVLPERSRAGVATWFRVPTNLLTVAFLVHATEDLTGTLHAAFVTCSLALLLATVLSCWFSSRYVETDHTPDLACHLLL